MKRWAVSLLVLATLVPVFTLATRCEPETAQITPPVTSVVVRTADTTPTATVAASQPEVTASPEPGEPITFAVIGDYGMDDAHERAVADLVASWDPDFIVTTGDDYYSPAGGTGTGRYDESTGAYYGAWLKDITTNGSRCPVGKAGVNGFFPSLGNHDYTDAAPGPETYLTYFTLPGAGLANTSGNERYYDFVKGPVHFFVLDSNTQESDGTSATSTQGRWLKAQLSGSTSTWNIVYFHHPAYSSDDQHGSTERMQWPFHEWGADAVLAGHGHTYERIARDGIVYFVNGLGGGPRYGFSTPVAGSVARYSEGWGAQRVTATGSTLTFEFRDVSDALVDRYRISKAPHVPAEAP